MSDPDLRARLAALDPAAGLPPLPDATREALLRRATADERPAPGRRRAGRRVAVLGGVVALAAAAAVAALALLPAGMIRSADDGPRRLTLALADDGSASCARLDDFAAAALAESDTAFRGTVEQVRGDRVAVAIEDRYRGAAGVGSAVLEAPQHAEDAVPFTPGDPVLIAAQDGRVMGCGLSGTASPELQRFYDAAFAG